MSRLVARSERLGRSSTAAVPARGLSRLRVVHRNLGPAVNFVPSRRWQPGSNVDVLLVQGFATGPLTLDVLARALTEEFELDCCVPRLGGMLGYLQTREVRHSGQQLAELLHSLPSNQRPWLVGHSMGGIIARDAVQRGGAADKVAGVVTLGSPHRGTPVALAGLLLGLGLISRAPRQMLPWARAVRDLNALPWPAELPITAIVSSSDVLCPPWFGSLPFADGCRFVNQGFAGHGHTELVRSQEIAAYVGRLITS
ncbi:MAG: hypothetical protein CMP23_08720 [Rickettsiales bacterium]|nr:hypothetical protein [Rickettsiales bacterium]